MVEWPRITIIHDNFPPESKVFRACSDGWPMILCNLKMLLETGMPLPTFTFLPQSAFAFNKPMANSGMIVQSGMAIYWPIMPADCCYTHQMAHRVNWKIELIQAN